MSEINAGRHTDICGNKRLVHEGCDGIVLYESERISFRSGKSLITVLGRDLRLVLLTDRELVIEGVISSVGFGF